MLYYRTETQVKSARVNTDLHDIYVETELLQDMTFDGEATEPTLHESHAVLIALHRDDGTPRADRTLRVTASEPAEIIWRGVSHTVSQDAHLDVVTDGAGRCRLDVRAGHIGEDGAFHSGLATAELYLRGGFMAPETTVILRPNARLIGALGSLSADHLNAAADWTGQPVLQPGLNGSAHVEAAAQTVRALTSVAVGAGKAARDAAGGSSYCNAASDPVALHAQTADQQPPGLYTASFSFALGQDGSAHFTEMSQSDAAAAYDAAVNGPATRGLASELWHGVETGALKISHGVAYAAGGALSVAVTAVSTAIHDPKEFFYDVAIGSLFEALRLAHGVLNAVVTGVKRLIQALSYAFDRNILKAVACAVENLGVATMASFASGPLATLRKHARSEVKTSFSSARMTDPSASAALDDQIGGRSPLQSDAAYSKKPTPSQGATKDHWLLHKVMDAISGGAVDPGVAPFTLSSGAEKAFEAIIAQLGSVVSHDVTRTLHQAYADLKATGDPGLLARAGTALVDLIRGLAHLVQDVAAALIDSLFDFMDAVIKELLAFATHPMTSIPFVSRFYAWVMGKDMTLAGMMALVGAIPTGFALAWLSPDPEYLRKGATAPRKVIALKTRGALEVCTGVFQIIHAVGSTVLAAADLAAAYAKISEYQEIPGSKKPMGPAALRWLRFGFALGSLVISKGMLLASLGTNIESTTSGPTLSWIVPPIIAVGIHILDLGILGIRGADPELTMNVAVPTALWGVGSALAIGIIACNAPKMTTDLALHIAFATLVAASLVTRIVPAIGATRDLRTGMAGLVISGGLLGSSGVIAIARGGVALHS
ncbi:hypothetical protein [Rubrimonas cliftonensis]|uniref:Uncharacterized protein n=1 Tax=Rubrimonas cliftonensis TaxID=89524 RepID=A0A1H4GB20_9RHOB|nr:hypothetical protein [Rubrimonas cliftonensis]SEB06799.1 hypothetical protein SAMN05444370_1484 [Rubrimonas cliftonensis]